MTEPVVPVGWRPWPHQLSVWNARFRDGKKRFLEVWHRRAGKDIVGENLAAVEMFKRPGVYWHMFPTYAQARKAIWQGSTNDGRKFLDYLPAERVKHVRNDEMRVTLDAGNGKESVYQMIGGDQPDRIVGSNPFGVIFSEFSLMNPVCWELVRPILAANDGWAYFAFTPRGYNHAYSLYEKVKDNSDWHVSVLDIGRTARADGSPIMTDEMVKEQIAEGMAPELARQEFYCDWSAPMTGAYFGKEMDEAERDGRITTLRWERDEPVHTSWDLGVRDTMVVWFYQVIDGWVHYIDLMAHSGEGVDWYVKQLDRKPYVYGKHYAPHDVTHREVGTGKSPMDTARRLGLRFTVVPRVKNVDVRVNAIRLALPKCRFDAEKCSQGIAALRQYRKEFDQKGRVWSARPVHDWTSHFADAFGTGAQQLPALTPGVRKAPRWQSQQTWDEVLADHDARVARSRMSRDIARL